MGIFISESGCNLYLLCVALLEFLLVRLLYRFVYLFFYLIGYFFCFAVETHFLLHEKHYYSWLNLEAAQSHRMPKLEPSRITRHKNVRLAQKLGQLKKTSRPKKFRRVDDTIKSFHPKRFDRLEKYGKSDRG